MSKRRVFGWLGLGLAAAGGFLAGVLLIVALGGVVQDHTKTVAHVIVHTTTKTHTTTSTATVTITPPNPDVVTVPDVVGDQLDEAESKLQDHDLDFEEDGGGVFGVFDASSWQVTDQDPQAGAHVDKGTVVVLQIARS
jgi:PASTA domain